MMLVVVLFAWFSIFPSLKGFACNLTIFNHADSNQLNAAVINRTSAELALRYKPVNYNTVTQTALQDAMSIANNNSQSNVGFIAVGSTCAQSNLHSSAAQFAQLPLISVPVDTECVYYSSNYTFDMRVKQQDIYRAASAVLGNVSAHQVVLFYDDTFSKKEIENWITNLTAASISVVSSHLSLSDRSTEIRSLMNETMLDSRMFRHFAVIGSSANTIELLKMAHNITVGDGLLNRKFHWLLLNPDLVLNNILAVVPDHANVAVIRDSSKAALDSDFFNDPQTVTPLEVKVSDAIYLFANACAAINASGGNPSSISDFFRSGTDQVISFIGQQSNVTVEIISTFTSYLPHATTFKVTANWTSSQGLITSEERIFPNIFTDFRNATLFVATKKNSPFLTPLTTKATYNGVSYDMYSGVIEDMMQELAKRMKFNYYYTPSPDGYTGGPDGNGGYNGLIGAVYNGLANLSAYKFTATYARSGGVDFSYPYIEDPNGIVVTRPQGADKTFTFLQPYSAYSWYCIIAGLILSGFVIWVFSFLSPVSAWNIGFRFAVKDEVTLSENIWNIIGSLMEQGQEFYPWCTSARLANGIWWWICIVILNTYTANLIAFLTVNTVTLPIKSIEDLSLQSDYIPIVSASSNLESLFKTSSNPVFQRISALMQGNPALTSRAAIVDLMLTSSKKYAYMTDLSATKFVAMQNCEKLVHLPETYNNGFFLSFALPKNAYFADAMNYHIRKMVETGFVQRSVKYWYAKESGASCSSSSTGVSGSSSIGLESILGVFIIVGGFFGTGVLLLFLEFLWKRYLEKPFMKWVEKVYESK